jgi:hypothetical protein
MNELVVINENSEISIRKSDYIKKIFDVASTNGDKLSISYNEGTTFITWSNGFGIMIPEKMSMDDEAFQAARTYNLTLGLGFSEPNIL